MTQLTQSPCFKSAGVASSAALPGRTARYKYDAPFRACSTGMIASPSEVMTSRWFVCVCNIATCPTWSIVRSSSRNGTAEAAQSCVIASSVTKHDLPIAPMRDILLRNRTGEYSCREQACRNLTDLDTMLRAAFACHIVEKPASRTWGAAVSPEFRDGLEPDFGTTSGDFPVVAVQRSMSCTPTYAPITAGLPVILPGSRKIRVLRIGPGTVAERIGDLAINRGCPCHSGWAYGSLVRTALRK